MFVIGKGSKVNLSGLKINFYDLAIEKIGLILKDMNPLSGKEVVTMFNIMYRLMDRKENQIDLDGDDMEFVKKYIGDIR